MSIVGLLVNLKGCLCSACIAYAVTPVLWCSSPIPVVCCYGTRGVALFVRIPNFCELIATGVFWAAQILNACVTARLPQQWPLLRTEFHANLLQCK